MASPEETSAESFGRQVPGTLLAAGTGSAWTDMLVEVYRRRRTEASSVVPAVAEPLVVLIPGRQSVRERTRVRRHLDGPFVQVAAED